MEEPTEFLKKVEDIIEQNLANPLLNGAYIANKMNTSRMQLHRYLKTFRGLPAGRLIKYKRIEYAKNELIRTKKHIYTISKEVGISNPTHFAKIFKAIVGVSPRGFRQENN